MTGLEAQKRLSCLGSSCFHICIKTRITDSSFLLVYGKDAETQRELCVHVRCIEAQKI